MEEYRLDSHRLIKEIHKRPALWNNKNVLYHNRDSTSLIWTELSSIFKCPKAVLKSKWKGLRDTFRAEIKKEQTHRKSKYPNRNRPVWIHYKNLQFLREQMMPRPPVWELNDNQNHRVLNKNQNNHSNDNDNGQSINQEESAEKILKNPIKINFITPDDSDTSSRTMDTVIASADNEYIESIVKKEPIDIVDNGDYQYNTGDSSNNEEIERNASEEIIQVISPEQVLSNNNEESMPDSSRFDDNYYFLMSLLPHIKTLPAERRMLLRIQMQELVYKEVYQKNINTN